AIQTKGLGDVFLYVDLPPGTTDADLEITFRPPGWRLGFAGMAFGFALLVASAIVHYRNRGRRQNFSQPQTEAGVVTVSA
ncbi:MAG: hypothetical protein WAW17_30685, partial [Rhodococcus sp. (in: high G+C Gram-positive bacteria)]|uniref:hypothetical protein n=1 Tax=Rhodococcus sp. TaxID=1831 RepID=UPI003BAE1CBD